MSLILQSAILYHVVIIVDEGELLRIITQPDHARFAAELLSLWRRNGLPDHPRREELLFAVREHDNGWREADAAPWIDPTALRPYDFTTYPASGRLDIWKRAILRFADQQPYAALLIATHAEAIHQPLDAAWRNLFEEIDSQRQEWFEMVGTDLTEVLADYRYLRLADALSLLYCTGGTGSRMDPSVTARVEAETLQLDPFPLAGTTTFQIAARWVPNQPYSSDSQFVGELARARWGHLPVRVAPF